jgi:signal transduction histidine kinase
MRTFALLSATYVALTLAVVPWAREAGIADPHIVVAYGLAVATVDLCTALMLGALYRDTGRTAHLLLCCAYFFGALMAGLHVATFPGALYQQPLIGDGQTVSWLYLAWRLGAAALFFATLLVAPKDAPQDARRGRRLLVALALTLAGTAALAALAVQVRFEGLSGDRFTELGTTVQWVAVGLHAAAFALLWGRRAFGDVLYLWVGLVLLASIADLTLSNLGGARYTIGWHAARVNLAVSACLLLAYLLGDAVAEKRAMSRISGLAAYGGAVAVTLTALHLRWVLDPWLDSRVPYATLYGAVAIAVWFGGLGPAVLAMVVGYALINVRYISPVGELALNGAAEAISLALFALSCSLIIVLGEAMRRARDRYRASDIEVKERAAQLQRADANKSQFLAVLSHELRNPLAPLRNGLTLLKMQREGPATTETHDMMERQIVQLTRLIDDLLDVSRIDRGKMELRTAPVELAAVMRTGVETARPNIDAKGHTLVASYPETPLYVEGDAVRLAQVVANLLNNAAKFTPAKGCIELATQAADGAVVLRVADNGIGIAREHLHEVFDMFVQLDDRHVASGGLGLGLTLARAIVRRHGGEIEAKSPGRGKGSEFLMRLPLVGAPAKEESQVVEAAPLVRRRVLVVDDNVDAAQTLAQYLRLTGHRVESALDGEAALRIAEILHPDVAFIDLNMPRMDGAEVARRLRLTPWGRKARLVALTGMGQQGDVERTREAGFDEHITKPADLQRLSRLAAG